MEGHTGHSFENVQIGDQARAVLGNVYYSNQLASPRNYNGHYAYSSLRVVSTFVPRPSLHDKLHQQLVRKRTDADGQSPRLAVVWGLGGAGKSQLVLDYHRQHRQKYNASFWVEAGQKQTIERDFLAIYHLLFDVPTSSEDVSVEDAVIAVKNWFSRRSGGWIFVFDGADNIDNATSEDFVDIQHFIPDVAHVDSIIVTRSGQATGMVQEAVEVAEMELEQAKMLFLACAKLENTSSNEAITSQIVSELGCLALAVSLSGTYVSQTARLKRNLSGYLEEYRQRRKEILARKPSRLIHQYGESVLTTWETTFNAVANGGSTNTSRLLTLLGFIGFSDIYMQLFLPTIGNDHKQTKENESTLTWDEGIFDGATQNTYMLEECLGVLLSYGLLQEQSDQSYSMHKLVHAWVFDRMSAEEHCMYMTQSSMLLRDAIERGDQKPEARQRLVPHVMANFEAVSNASLQKSQRIVSLSFLGMNGGYLSDMGRWADALTIQKVVYVKTLILQGDEHPSTIFAAHNLAATLGDQGKLEEAATMKKEVLEKMRRILGDEHPSTITAMNNLANTLGDQGKIEEAAGINKEVLEKRRRILGEEHPDTIMAMSNLAVTLGDQDKLEEAAVMKNEVLEKMRRTLGDEHPSTITAMNNLAATLGDQGKLEEAAAMKKEVLEKRRRILGDEDPSTITATSNLAATLGDQGKLEEAIPLSKKAYAEMVSLHGARHPHSVIISTVLRKLLITAFLQNVQEAPEDGEAELCQQVISDFRHIFGAQHLFTRMLLNLLGDVWRHKNDLDEAERMYL